MADVTLRARALRLPDQPGVYLFRNAQGGLLYVGKALSLRKRVASYFGPERRLSPRVATMMKRVADVEARPTASEAEALLLEARLIKQEKPYYNVSFRDDKSYPMLKVTNERFPRLLVTRRRSGDGAQYFGPYPDAGMMREAVRFFRRVFPMRTCRRFPNTPCLEFHLGQCLAPCVNNISETAYNRIVADLVAFLGGKRDALLRDLSRRMTQAARREAFEEAARLRDQIQALTTVITAKEKSAPAGPLEQLQAALRLPRMPRRIEAFDISNIFGRFAVGSMVVFTDGQPHKAHYRHFRIRASAPIHGGDDYQMMREVIRRRYGGTLARTLPLPDLILVDGGRGQLGVACEELAALSRPAPMGRGGTLALTMPAIGLAKRLEHIMLPAQEAPIVLLPTSPVLHLVQRIRDEAHRFAITHHRRLRGKAVSASALDAVAGIGPARKRALLRRFGSLAGIAAASVEDIAAAGRLSNALATTLQKEVRG